MAIEGMNAKCVECKSIQPDSYIRRSPFGFDAPCKFCGGVCAAIPAQFVHDPEIDSQMDQQRGLDHDPQAVRQAQREQENRGG